MAQHLTKLYIASPSTATIQRRSSCRSESEPPSGLIFYKIEVHQREGILNPPFSLPIFISFKENRSNTIFKHLISKLQHSVGDDHLPQSWLHLNFTVMHLLGDDPKCLARGNYSRQRNHRRSKLGSHSGGSCSRPPLVRPSQADGNRARETLSLERLSSIALH
ncbi:hypothetical protein RHGRI_020839 [Rhododendron griersonianum]|uniref:Uncharacterized protein n=1 Tax=Rhododendron griersonianum TaxID=479676 RepID=A0AAV6JHS0_9ERIC|nr:hypothetical protein RHGRI_020839 [Rhododendron griersonianum]